MCYLNRRSVGLKSRTQPPIRRQSPPPPVICASSPPFLLRLSIRSVETRQNSPSFLGFLWHHAERCWTCQLPNVVFRAFSAVAHRFHCSNFATDGCSQRQSFSVPK